MQTEAKATKLDLADSHSHHWGVILAGGDGQRLLPLTRRIAGDDRPKQFCAIMDGATLLRQTRRRVSRMLTPWRTLLALTRTHERFYADEVAGLPSSSLLIQPCNRGTAPAILYSLMRVREMDPGAIVAFFPSDHHFTDDEALASDIAAAFAAAAFRSESVVLLGITPESPEVGYGWIEPGAILTSQLGDRIYQVNRFWEKPSTDLALSLMERGCLWNSFIMVGHVCAFLRLIRHTLPHLVESFECIRPSFGTTAERNALSDLYSEIDATCFSQRVLSAHPYALAVLCGKGLGWSDLGEPSRVFSVLERKGVKTEWNFDSGRGEERSAGAGGGRASS
ncbi:MAG: sugar phosphate nucleotidyltransferase [Bradyrhizobium sp.]